MKNEPIDTIHINMNKACVSCGAMGASESGMCMSCVADTLMGTGERLTTEALVSATTQINKLLATHSTKIHRAYLIAGEGKLSIGLTIELSPSEEMANAIKCTAKINFIESRVKDEITTRVSTQQKLPI